MSRGLGLTTETAVLFMAYGTPRTLDEVEPYFTNIRGGRPPSETEVRDLRGRYEAVGNRTPLLAITERQAQAAARLLRNRGHAVRAYVGMKHWHPFVDETIKEIAHAGLSRIVAIPLAPFYSAVSTGGYRKAVDEAIAGRDISVTFVKEWSSTPKLFDTWRTILMESLEDRPLGRDGHLLFTAHSLPKDRMPPGDPYEDQLRTLAAKLANSVDLRAWTFAFQSVGMAGGEWLGPSVSDVLDTLAAGGASDVLVAPIGFVADNLETLYDLDRKLTAQAEREGMTLRRTPVPNDRPEFVEALAHVVASRL
ncbi:MAG: ferrochelatase [Thermoplasmata archaeon]